MFKKKLLRHLKKKKLKCYKSLSIYLFSTYKKMSEIVVRKLCDEKLRYVLFSENIVGRYSDKTAKYMKKRS